MSPNQRHAETFVAETSHLLNKSLSNKSLASHEDIQTDLEIQIQTLRKRKYDGKSTFAYKLKLFLTFIGALLALLILGTVSKLTWVDEPTKIDNFPIDVDRFPLSLLDPIHDLQLAQHGRSRSDPSFPSYYYGSADDPKMRPFLALPTNAWYQNLLQAPQQEEPTNLQRVYPGPYLLDVVGTIPGLRIHPTDTVTSDTVMQLSFNEQFGLVLGATRSISSTKQDIGDKIGGSDTAHSKRYNVLETTDLGITLEWQSTNMTSSIVKGMAYVTMEYEKVADKSNEYLFPTIASQFEWQNPVLVDGTEIVFDCSKDILVKNDMELYFPDSDYSWVVFFSEPVLVNCSTKKENVLIQIVEYDKQILDGSCSFPSKTLVVRVALTDQCTNGRNPMSCRKGLGNRLPDEPKREEYVNLLRTHANVYSGRNTSFSYVIPDGEGNNKAELIFDWDAIRMSDLSCNSSSNGSIESAMLNFAIPHQIDRLPSYALPNKKRYCKSSLIGPTCLVLGLKWEIPQELPQIDFRAKRPPRPEYIPMLAEALSADIHFQIPKYFKRGAGDTYFSGKILAKLARILLIAEEVISLCDEDGGRDYLELCQNTTFPNEEEMKVAVRQLREGVEIWINGKAETPLIYDTSWGGVVSCGCYMENGKCTNSYPNCPGFTDPGLNFGNGFYNDHHFHYGYHIYAAAVVAHFDSVWGMNNFENVLLLVRDIANPSEDDKYFPMFRHKDWYQGSSWASGIAYPAYLNGKNQESSSEAIAAYEGVALFGRVMHDIWQEVNAERNAAISKQITNIGRLLAGTELVSAKRYWHISDDKISGVNSNGVRKQKIYPHEYSQNVVGILWQTMAQFGTWFGAAPYLPIGIQLLPLTPISEDRDDIEWMNSIYGPLTYSCATNFDCTESGWSILQIATLATVGYAPEAALKLKELPDEAFENAGGNGQSRANTIWFIATRLAIENPIPIVNYDKRGKEEIKPKVLYELKDCYQPNTCTEDVLNRYAGLYTCKDRISWLIHSQGLPQWQACWRVAGLEFVDVCGPCNPDVTENITSKEQSETKYNSTIETEEYQSSAQNPAHSNLQCPPCTQTECSSDLNRCPVSSRTFVCTQGTSKGGCSGDYKIWKKEDQCERCCEMTKCFGLKDHEAQKFTKDGNALTKSSCPPCPPEICFGELDQCPIHTAPYLCTGGLNKGGCASAPWNLSNGLECTECCELKVNC